MSLFADIAIPVNVRQVFSYQVPKELETELKPGMRVYVPFSNRMAIGMVVNLHSNKPPFKVKAIEKLLDAEPVMSEEILRLNEWIHSHYYSSYGEAIQASLPAGLNFVSDVFVCTDLPSAPPDLKPQENELMEALAQSPDQKISMDEAGRRWGSRVKRMVSVLLKRKLVYIREESRIKVTPRMETVWYWSDGQLEKAQNLISETNPKALSKWISALKNLVDLGLPLRKAEVAKLEGCTAYTLKKILDEGFIREEKEEAVEKLPDLDYEPEKIKALNTQQQKAYEKIEKPLISADYQAYLLFGITGSGKTEVYIHALKKTLELGRGGLVLVPEIALTPQTMRRFYQIFGDQIAILHSRLTDRERLEAWMKLKRGEKKIAIGPRSALFAPVQNLGLIVLDEEHDSSYKQEDPAPRYHAREAALMRGYLSKSVVICGSATPSMQSLNLCARDKMTLLELTARHADAELPHVHILDLRQYRGKAMKGPLAIPVYLAIEESLARKEQIIVLLNRRGFASFVLCKNCGAIPECPHCSVTLTHHSKTNQLRCHYCGYSKRQTGQCHSCGRKELSDMGSGTQRIEDEITELFPMAKILRMDQDTTTGKDAHNKILSAFGRGEADILLGTQLVSKGLDFPNVTLVAVVNSDTELAFPSYRSSERMYQLLSQVAGRSGRGKKSGKVYLQTWKPDHPAFAHVARHDFKSFAREELKFRKAVLYPPYVRLIKFVFRSANEQMAGKVAGQMRHSFYRVYKDSIVMGPSPASIYRQNNKFIWELYVKLKPEIQGVNLEILLDKVFAHYESNKPDGASAVRINVHVDAI